MIDIKLAFLMLITNEHVQITEKMNGKMVGFQSLNTSPLANKFCHVMNQLIQFICGNCYSCSMSKMYWNMHKRFAMNGYLLSSTLPVLPTIFSRVFRISAHGELKNVLHLFNICRLAEKNPDTRFVIWTKRLDLIRELFLRWKYVKPTNLRLIWSVSQKNRINVSFPADVEHLFEKMFIVHDEDQTENVDMNCQQQCSECMLCYSDNDVKVINEQIK